ncbi:hypothetical protein BXZ70DRAFT_1065483 [Cristinia sonorae]|uniref:Uncharacterized protein n=1 Tax=Cristinia sonorae TaxID=1940300 RepID=A0A8K0UMR2_9AGAR|nr:hypothetical protein BXZ70DRAFT_1065483 [Cristinia sonorae]
MRFSIVAFIAALVIFASIAPAFSAPVRYGRNLATRRLGRALMSRAGDEFQIATLQDSLQSWFSAIEQDRIHALNVAKANQAAMNLI